MGFNIFGMPSKLPDNYIEKALMVCIEIKSYSIIDPHYENYVITINELGAKTAKDLFDHAKADGLKFTKLKDEFSKKMIAIGDCLPDKFSYKFDVFSLNGDNYTRNWKYNLRVLKKAFNNTANLLKNNALSLAAFAVAATATYIAVGTSKKQQSFDA